MAVEGLSITYPDSSQKQARVPAVLRHLVLLSDSLEHQAEHVSYVHVYARPLRYGAPAQLKFIGAAESGIEGIACVDDAARAALLALEVYEEQGSPVARRLAETWLKFVMYMQEPDGRFLNFILDRRGRKNRHGRTSYPGGQWWTARAIYALAAAWRVTGEQSYLQALSLGRMAGTANLKVASLQALALQEIFRVDPSPALRLRICALCDRIIAGGPAYLRDRAGQALLQPWGYHQLQALARAGRLFSRLDYLAIGRRTVRNVVTPLIAGEFAAILPWEHAPRCAYDVSSLVLGLEELYHATHKQEYRDQALACAGWLRGHNPSGSTLYDPRTGFCADGLSDDGVSDNCGAESAIEAGFVELSRQRLLQ
jgi:hypothetical protein